MVRSIGWLGFIAAVVLVFVSALFLGTSGYLIMLLILAALFFAAGLMVRLLNVVAAINNPPLRRKKLWQFIAVGGLGFAVIGLLAMGLLAASGPEVPTGSAVLEITFNGEARYVSPSTFSFLTWLSIGGFASLFIGAVKGGDRGE